MLQRIVDSVVLGFFSILFSVAVVLLKRRKSGRQDKTSQC
jgi:hypothetical protein